MTAIFLLCRLFLLEGDMTFLSLVEVKRDCASSEAISKSSACFLKNFDALGHCCYGNPYLVVCNAKIDLDPCAGEEGVRQVFLVQKVCIENL